MPDVGAVTFVTSSIPYLEPIAGASLAINLVYLTLGRFRYRRAIIDRACSELHSIETEGEQPESILKSDQYQHLLYLAGLKDNDGEDNHTPAKGQPPSEIWCWVYRFIFSHHQDIVVTIILSGLAMLALVVGAGQNIGQLGFLAPVSTGGLVDLWFWCLALGLVLPVLFVFIGRSMVRRANKHCGKQGAQIAAILQDVLRKGLQDHRINPSFRFFGPEGPELPPYRR